MLMPKVIFPFKKGMCLLNNVKLFFSLFRAKDSVKHFHVEYTGYSLKFGFNEFSSVKDFVKHFANQPLIGSETGKLWTDNLTCETLFRDGDESEQISIIVYSVELCAYHMQLDMFKNILAITVPYATLINYKYFSR